MKQRTFLAALLVIACLLLTPAPSSFSGDLQTGKNQGISNPRFRGHVHTQEARVKLSRAHNARQREGKSQHSALPLTPGALELQKAAEKLLRTEEE